MTNLIYPVWMRGKNGVSDGNCLSKGIESRGTTVADRPTKNSTIRLPGWLDEGPFHTLAVGKIDAKNVLP